MNDDLQQIDQEWNELAANFDSEVEIEFLDEDDLVEFVHDSEL